MWVIVVSSGLQRDMPLWRDLAKRIVAAENDPSQAELRIVVYAITPSEEADNISVRAPSAAPSAAAASAGGRRRQLGIASHSLRQQFLSGKDAVHQAIFVSDGAGRPLASVWISVGVNAALTAICSNLPQFRSLSAALPPPAERRHAAELKWTNTMAAVRLQAMARSFRARRKLRLAACELPPLDCTPRARVAAARGPMQTGRRLRGCTHLGVCGHTF